MAKHHLKQGTVEKDTTTTNFTDNKNQKMEVGRTHPKKEGNQYHKTGTRMAPPRDTENREDQRTPGAEDYTPH